MRTIREAMTADPICVTPETVLREAAQRMERADAGILPVLDGDRLVGVITDRDLVIRAIARGADPRTTRVADYLSENVCTVTPDTPAERAVQLMEQRQIRRLMVVDGQRLVGVVSLGDLAECEPDAAEAVLVEVSKSDKTMAHGRQRPGTGM